MSNSQNELYPLSRRAAFRAMRVFLDAYANRGDGRGEVRGLVKYLDRSEAGERHAWDAWMAWAAALDPLTADQAYRAMLSFVELYWERLGRPEDIRNLLSVTAMWADGQPADSAQWNDWEDAVAAVAEPPAWYVKLDADITFLSRERGGRDDAPRWDYVAAVWFQPSRAGDTPVLRNFTLWPADAGIATQPFTVDSATRIWMRSTSPTHTDLGIGAGSTFDIREDGRSIGHGSVLRLT